MNRLTTRFFILGFALAIASRGGIVLACEHCLVPDASDCLACQLVESFQAGGDLPAPYQTQGSGWTTTASGLSPFGETTILTWSIVPDGTSLPTGVGEPSSPSNLRAFLDGIHHGGASPGGADLTQRAWFPLIKSCFDRWDAVSALRISYEPNDSGSTLGGLSGALGVRGDIRLGGHYIDGTTSPTVVAYSYFPNNSDMVIDTAETGRFGNSYVNYLQFRNTVTHELGHGLGLNHPASSTDRFLMEAYLDTSFDGPQLDDILGIHRLYGDRYEENNGNDNASLATNLGTLSPGQSVSIGTDATDTVVAPTDIDFVSINMSSDIDYFKITLSQGSLLDITLTPLGPSYMEGPHGGTQTLLDTAALNILSLYVFDGTGSNVLAFSSSGGLGAAEYLTNIPAPAGNYYIRISGDRDAAQFYQLDVAVNAVPEPAAVVLLVCGLIGGGTNRRNGR
jgi:serralysin